MLIFTPLHFCTPLMYLSPCPTDPSPHTPVQSRTVQRPTAQHSTATVCCIAMYRNVTFQLIAVYCRHSTASPARTAVLQCLPAVSSRPSPGPPNQCSPQQHPLNRYLQHSLRYPTSYMSTLLEVWIHSPTEQNPLEFATKVRSTNQITAKHCTDCRPSVVTAGPRHRSSKCNVWKM